MIGIIGAGNMGMAIASAMKGKFLLSDKNKRISDNVSVSRRSDVIILAVKPKDFDRVLKQEVCCGASSRKLIISIAAGITTKHIEDVLGKDIPVIRVMPNMAASIGEAISCISRGKAAGDEHVKIAREIFSTVGDVVCVAEDLMDAVTAVSGSGPAYFFSLIEAMIEGAEKLGLDKETARRLVSKTALGSAKLFEALKEDPAGLIKRVASKGGTTEAAFKVFEKRCFKGIVHDAIKCAHKRSKSLSKG